MEQSEKCRAEKIAKLNDRCRLGLDRSAKFVFTKNLLDIVSNNNSIQEIIETAKLRKLIAGHKFEEGDDPYGERDFGAFQLGENKIFFKIDYYDADNMNFGSEDPADASKTCRVLTVMLASDY